VTNRLSAIKALEKEDAYVHYVHFFAVVLALSAHAGVDEW
jgi:hypothetical protein